MPKTKKPRTIIVVLALALGLVILAATFLAAAPTTTPEDNLASYVRTTDPQLLSGLVGSQGPIEMSGINYQPRPTGLASLGTPTTLTLYTSPLSLTGWGGQWSTPTGGTSCTGTLVVDSKSVPKNDLTLNPGTTVIQTKITHNGQPFPASVTVNYRANDGNWGTYTAYATARDGEIYAPYRTPEGSEFYFTATDPAGKICSGKSSTLRTTAAPAPSTTPPQDATTTVAPTPTTPPEPDPAWPKPGFYHMPVTIRGAVITDNVTATLHLRATFHLQGPNGLNKTATVEATLPPSGGELAGISTTFLNLAHDNLLGDYILTSTLHISTKSSTGEPVTETLTATLRKTLNTNGEIITHITPLNLTWTGPSKTTGDHRDLTATLLPRRNNPW